MGAGRRPVGRDVERLCDAERRATVPFLRARDAHKRPFVVRRRLPPSDTAAKARRS